MSQKEKKPTLVEIVDKNPKVRRQDLNKWSTQTVDEDEITVAKPIFDEIVAETEMEGHSSK